LSWRIRVRHQTGYRYSGTVTASYNEARMTPQSGMGQFTLEHRLDVHPIARPFVYRDYWGTVVHAFDLHTSHNELTVTAIALVETSSRPEAASGCSWDELDALDEQDRWCELLGSTQYVTPDDDLDAVGRELRAAANPRDAVLAAADWVAEHMEYVAGATDVATVASEAYRRRQGVCQDFAHVLLAILRAAGIPARYASGYLHPDADTATGATVAGQSHAWVEAWIGEWMPIDPTNRVPVGERHVLVARGRDYADVAPLKGIYSGGPAQSVGVVVELTRLG
jgi:transglutaminase-like putative cysteine protease